MVDRSISTEPCGTLIPGKEVEAKMEATAGDTDLVPGTGYLTIFDLRVDSVRF